ncbi:Las17-binding protein actin regulator [Rhodovulum bhavnagarense]|uniref:Las17-binding protein actin regulator n=1 Tax=Rhodovulum bhavnagarense TaxID=992286 RepID=A0A4R2RCK9_9RHOB|nr:lipid-binding SYLF domain-containing protein [Rhodovulum bhavnagarense]TCP60543.1 Las17-binding protein actin regulator [Rhodovulum bhavnagarense]
MQDGKMAGGVSRRRFIAAAGAATALSACGNGVGSTGSYTIDSRVDATRDYLFMRYPDTQTLAEKAQGILWMPLITKAGLGVGGAYGRGALRVDNVTVDYYSATQASFGFQIGAQQYAHALFFMTPEALREFRAGAGWSAGGDIEYAVRDQGGNLSARTMTALDPVIALIFGQQGLIIGASLEGTKYTRIIP